MTVPIIGEVTAQTTEPAASRPSGVKACAVSTGAATVGKGATCARAGVGTPRPTAIASNAAEATRRIPHHFQPTEPAAPYYTVIGAPVRAIGSIAIDERRLSGARGRRRRRDELAAFRQFMQHRVQFPQIVTRK